MNIPNWGKLFAGIAKAVADFETNKAPTPQHAITGNQAAAELTRLDAMLPAMIAWFTAHPGAITAADDLLESLEAQGFTWAGDAEIVINGAPDALAEAKLLLPIVLYFIADGISSTTVPNHSR